MRLVLLLATLGAALLGARAARSQSAPGPAPAPAAGVPPPPATRTLYFSATGRRLPSADSADHREELVYRDSIGGTLRVYYPSGQLRRVVPYLHFAREIKYGAECSFYETGEIQSRCDYTLAGPVGPRLRYYRAGQVRLRATPADAAHPNGLSELFGPDGQPLALPPDQRRLPTLNGGGTAAIAAAVQRRVRYPVEALRARVSGKVLVAFVVDDAGFVRDVRIVQTASPLFNPAVLRAVAALGRLTPGALAGEPVDVTITVPVTFALR